MAKIKVKQHDITDCGAACLVSISAFYQLQMPIAKIRSLAGTDQKGTNVLGLITAAQNLDFTAKGVKGTIDHLTGIPLPAIAHMVYKNGLQHYVVVYKVSKHNIQIMDPADGKLHRIPLEEFKATWTGVLVLLAPNETFKPGQEKISIFSRFAFLLQPHRSVFIQILFGSMVYTILGLSTAIFVQKLIDQVLPNGNQNLLNLMGIIMIVILVLQFFINHSKTIFTLQTGQQIDARLILGYYKHLLKLPQQFFDQMRVGEIISRINDAVKIRTFINDVLVNIVVNLFILFFSFALMFTYYWKLALVMAFIIPIYSLVYLVSNKLNKKTQRTLMERSANLETQLVESIHAIGTIKRFGLESFANIKTENRFIHLLQSVYSSGINMLWISNSNNFISGLFTIIILWTGASFVLSGAISPGELLSFYALIGYFTGPVKSLIDMNRNAQDALIAADRLFEIMDLNQEGNQDRIVLEKNQVGHIQFKDVSFRYGSRTQVFEQLNLTIEKAKVTAIVGESGSGKTTLLSLLQHIYPIQSGNILIGALDIKYISLESLRQIVSVVPQQIDLFAGHIIDNIAVGDFSPNMSRMIEICEMLGMMPFIEKLPNGFHTYIGENGTSLSGGQRQRLAIARALYRDPEILVLDEATSSLDSASENHVQKALHLFQSTGKTAIVIAHRLSTIAQADKIIVMKEGKVIEEGTHTELLKKKEHYYQMWASQSPLLTDMQKTKNGSALKSTSSI